MPLPRVELRQQEIDQNRVAAPFAYSRVDGSSSSESNRIRGVHSGFLPEAGGSSGINWNVNYNDNDNGNNNAVQLHEPQWEWEQINWL